MVDNIQPSAHSHTLGARMLQTWIKKLMENLAGKVYFYSYSILTSSLLNIFAIFDFSHSSVNNSWSCWRSPNRAEREGKRKTPATFASFPAQPNNVMKFSKYLWWFAVAMIVGQKLLVLPLSSALSSPMHTYPCFAHSGCCRLGFHRIPNHRTAELPFGFLADKVKWLKSHFGLPFAVLWDLWGGLVSMCEFGFVRMRFYIDYDRKFNIPFQLLSFIIKISSLEKIKKKSSPELMLSDKGYNFPKIAKLCNLKRVFNGILSPPSSCSICSSFSIFTPQDPLAESRNGRKFKLAARNNFIIYGDDDGEQEWQPYTGSSVCIEEHSPTPRTPTSSLLKSCNGIIVKFVGNITNMRIQNAMSLGHENVWEFCRMQT